MVVEESCMGRVVRLIPRLDIKGTNLIKGVHLEGLRVVGNPSEFLLHYYHAGADELLFMDCVASLYGRNHLSNLIRDAAKNVFIPITVGGGIRSVDNARTLLRYGADKIAVNTAAIKRPKLIQELSEEFGSQCVVLSVEAKKQSNGQWEAYIDNGRERTGRSVLDWVKEAVGLGAGEILLTSVDKEGTREGFDLDLVAAVSCPSAVPVIASGGLGTCQHLAEVVASGADAVAVADALHYRHLQLSTLREYAISHHIPVRLNVQT